ncbi:hypothetical protein [Blautia sp.]
MIIIGEKINGAIPSIKQAIEDHNEELIRERVAAQAAAGADYIDCAPSTAPEIEYDTMVWLIDLIQDVTDLPISIDSPNPLLLKRIIEEGRLKRPGMVNSVNAGCMTVAVEAGLDSAIMDPCSSFMMGTLYAAEALSQRDKGGRKYNRAFRKGIFK